MPESDQIERQNPDFSRTDGERWLVKNFDESAMTTLNDYHAASFHCCHREYFDDRVDIVVF